MVENKSPNTPPDISFVGKLCIYSDPLGAEIYINENPIIDDTGKIAKTPIMLTDVPEGIHSIRFRTEGYDDDIIIVNVIRYNYSKVYGILSPIPIPTPLIRT